MKIPIRGCTLEIFIESRQGANGRERFVAFTTKTIDRTFSMDVDQARKFAKELEATADHVAVREVIFD
jgi:hypothetical protein